MGPPLIGYISEIAGLRYSFAVIAVFGTGITLMVSRIKALQDSQLIVPESEADQPPLLPL
jgi:predicted MFS family arabinose efflux permease